MTEDKKVACYVRVSTSSQAKDDKYSIPEQIDILKNICIKNNFNYDLYQDLGISGETIEARPSIRELLDNCKKGIYMRVLVVDQDRLSRSVKDLQIIKEIFKDKKIKLMFQNALLDLDNEDDDFMSDIQGIFSKRELKIIAKRSARGRYQKAKQGKLPLGGNNIAYGYALDKDDRIIIDEEEAKVIRNIFNWQANEGLSSYKIAERLNSLGVITRFEKLGRISRSIKYNKVYKNKWTRSSVKHLLSKELYYKDEYIYAKSSKFNFIEPVRIKKEPIISKELFEKAKKQSNFNRTSTNISKIIYILTGKMKCLKCGRPYCGGRYSSQKKDTTYYYYRDMGRSNRARELDYLCNSASIKKDLIEGVVKDDIKQFLLNPENMNKYLLDDSKKYLNTDFEVVELEDRKAKINEEIDTLLDLYSNKDIPESITTKNIAKKLKDKDSEIKKIDNVILELNNKEVVEKIKIEKINTIKILFKSLVKGIEKLNSLEWKRIINKMIDEIGIDSICGHGKTNKLDVYITYNFNNFLENSKVLHWTSIGEGKGTLGFKSTRLIKRKN
jgi:site-specific DNA recombinase